MTHLTPALIVTLALAGCGLTPTGNLARSAIAHKGAVVADKALENAEWLLCKGSSVGAVVRRYGVSKSKADAWRTICRSGAPAKVITGPGG